MISERKFASSHSAFWQRALPFADHFVRRSNLRSMRSGRRVTAFARIERRAFVAELAFRQVCSNISNGCLLKAIGRPSEAVISETIEYFNRFEDRPNAESGPSNLEASESTRLAEEFVEFLVTQSWTESLAFRPAFPGCGFLGGCEGDLLFQDTLIEIKTVERQFRVVDFRQVLTYLTLNWASRGPEIRQVAIVNPRRGRWSRVAVPDLCMELSGRSDTDLFEDIVAYVSADEEANGTT